MPQNGITPPWQVGNSEPQMAYAKEEASNEFDGVASVDLNE
jgi:hypothetical protein